MNENRIDEFITQREAAAIMRCSEVSVWRLRKTGRLAFHRILGKVLFRRSDLEAFLSRQRRNGEVAE